MNRSSQSRQVLTSLLACLSVGMFVSPVHSAEGPFSDLSFTEACVKAEKAHRPVFIDFYTTWCGPCKMLDTLTWKDKTVIAWLTEKTIPLKIDAEKEVELAKKYSINAYPTLVFIKADGTEMDRILGYKPAEEFLDEANGVLQGKDALTRAREKTEGEGKTNPIARMKYGRLLWQKEKNEEALKELLWCYDEGAKHDPAFGDTRLSFLLATLLQMGKKYEPAQEAMDKRLAAAQKAVTSTSATEDSAKEIAALNVFMGKPKDTLALYDQLRKDKPKSKAVAGLREALLDQLMEEHRYNEIATADDFKAKIEKAFEMYKPAPATSPAPEDSKNQTAPAIDPMGERLAYQVGRYYQILVGAKKTKEAETLARRLLKTYASTEAYNSLAWNGYLTGAPSETHVAQARKAFEMSKGKNAAVVDTLARILKARGKQKEAVALVEKALETATTPFEKRVLKECLEVVQKEDDK